MTDNVTNELLLEHMVGFMTNTSAHESAITNMQVRLDRIERRLEPVDSPL